MDHASLDEIANAITARLDAIAEENGITIEYEVTSGQGDQTVLRQLSDQAIADGVTPLSPSPPPPPRWPPSPLRRARPR